MIYHQAGQQGTAKHIIIEKNKLNNSHSYTILRDLVITISGKTVENCVISKIKHELFFSRTH